MYVFIIISVQVRARRTVKRLVLLSRRSVEAEMNVEDAKHRETASQQILCMFVQDVPNNPTRVANVHMQRLEDPYSSWLQPRKSPTNTGLVDTLSLHVTVCRLCLISHRFIAEREHALASRWLLSETRS